MLHLNEGGRRHNEPALISIRIMRKQTHSFNYEGANNDGDGYENVTKKVTSNFIVLIPSRSIRQMLEFL